MQSTEVESNCTHPLQLVSESPDEVMEVDDDDVDEVVEAPPPKRTNRVAVLR